MIRTFLDTNAYTAFKQGDEDTVQVIRYADIVGISVIVLGELLAGFAVGTKGVIAVLAGRARGLGNVWQRCTFT